MGLVAKEGGGSKYPPIDEGIHTGVCYSIVDLGDVYSEKFENTSRKVLVTWEIPDETIEIDGKMMPRAISREYTLSLSSKANLRKDLEAWRCKKFDDEELKGFDLKNVLGKGCQLQVTHTSKGADTYANISAIMGLPKGVKPKQLVNDTVYFDLEAEGALNLLEKIPQWVQDKIKKSETYKKMTGQILGSSLYDAPVDALPDSDDLPF